MSLIDLLREAEDAIPPSHVPTVTEVAQIVGGLLAYLEHGGEKFEEAIKDGQAGVAKLFAPEAPAPEPPVSEAQSPPAAPSAPAPSDATSEQQQLYQEFLTWKAAQQRTTVGQPTAE